MGDENREISEDRAERVIPLPKPWLDGEAYQRLNELFYAAHPDDYFETRLQLLIVEAARPDVRRDVIAEGVAWRALEFMSPGRDEPDDVLHRAFVYSDAVNLLHHAGETLLRNYFGHAPDEDGKRKACPWIEIASVRDPGKFKQLVARRFDGKPLDDQRRRAMEAVFYRSKAAMGVEHAADVDESVDEIEDWLCEIGSRFVDEATLFNSIKHGFAIQAADPAFSIGAVDESSSFSHEGPGVRFLEREQSLEALWKVETRWISPEHLMGQTWFTIKLLRQLLQIGRAHYNGHALSQLEILRRGALRNLESARAERQGISSLSWGPGYTLYYERPLTCADCSRGPTPKEDQNVFRTWKARYRPGEQLARPLCPECAAKVLA